MNNKERNLQDRIKRAQDKASGAVPTENEDGKYNRDTQNGEKQESVDLSNNDSTDEVSTTQHSVTNNAPPPSGDEKKQRKQSGANKQFFRFGLIALAIGIGSFFMTNTSTVDTSESAASALNSKVSTAISAGVVLLKEDENIGAEDYTVTHQSNAEETKIWIWDYAAEDGDYVQVLVDGTPITESFMIHHKPKELIVPAVGTVQIKGIRDGGGGITYAVRYDANGTSYFNSAPEGEFNTYELIRE